MTASAIVDDLTVVIPVREGSSRIQRKIYLPFGDGTNLLEWKINQVKAVHRPDRILVSSNSDTVRETAEKHGVQFHPRSDHLSVGHEASFSEVIYGIVKDVQTEHFAWVTVVVPLMGPEDFRSAFRAYQSRVITGPYDSLVSVNRVQEYFWTDNGPLNYRANSEHTISQDLPLYYRVTNGLYMRDVESTLRDRYFLGPRPFMFESGMLAGIDIDYYDQYEVARTLLPLYEKRSPKNE